MDQRRAFLDTLGWSEGTTRVPGSDNGYNVLVGGTLFTSYADHPRKLVHLSPSLSSTAAGRYQLLAKYFDAYKSELRLPDFSPTSQDSIALQQIKECGALPAIDAGRFAEAIRRCAHIWASLPSAGYEQHENKLSDLQDVFIQAGGVLA